MVVVNEYTERRGERNAHRSCGFGGAAGNRSKPPTVWATPPGDNARWERKDKVLWHHKLS